MTQPSRKPWYRFRNIALALLVVFAGVLAWAGYWVHWALTVEPNVAVDYAAQLEQLSRDAQPPGENGWPDIERAVAICQQLDDAFPRRQRAPANQDRFAFEVFYYTESDFEELFYVDQSDIPRVRDEAEKALNWLEAHGAWDALARAAAKPNLVRTTSAQGRMLAGYMLEELAPLRQLARARTAWLHDTIVRDDVPSARAALDDIFTIRRALFAQPWMIDALAGDSIPGFAQIAIVELLHDGRVSKEMIRMLLAEFKINPMPIDLTLQLEGERRMFLDTVQWMYSDNGRGDGHLLVVNADLTQNLGGTMMPVESSKPQLKNLKGLFCASRATVTSRADRAFDRMVASFERPHREQVALADALDAEAEGIEDDDLLFPRLIPPLARSAAEHVWARMQFDGLTVMLAIEAYRADNGHVPSSLEDLVPQYLANVPTDCACDEPFHYRAEHDDEVDAPYVLYSCGRDCADDHGHFSVRTPDWALRPDAGPGYDFVINHPPFVPTN